MTNIVVRRLSAIAVVVVVSLGAASAWACVPQPWITVQPRASAPAGSEVTVDGRNFAGRSEVRWNGADGPLLATVDGPSFSAKVTIPDAPGGLYTLIALSRDAGGGINLITHGSFEVTAAGEAPSTTAPPQQAAPSTSVDDDSDSSSSRFTTAFAWAAAVVVLASGMAIGASAKGWRRRPDSPTSVEAA